jgi:hypothetical protein
MKRWEDSSRDVKVNSLGKKSLYSLKEISISLITKEKGFTEKEKFLW